MPATPKPNPVEATLRGIVATLTQANIAIPVILGTVTGIVQIVQALKGDTKPLAAILDDLEAALAANEARGRAELERLQALARAEGRR